MAAQSPKEITQLLLDWSDGDRSALDKLIPAVHGELRRLATRYIRLEGPGHTLQSLDLINEAYIRLVDYKGMPWQNRAHFFAVAAQLMRHILIDHARSRKYAKRGGTARKVLLDEAAVLSEERATELVALDDALMSLASIDSRKSQVVEMRFFGGLSIEETASVMKVSSMTIQREWRWAKAFLYREMNRKT